MKVFHASEQPCGPFPLVYPANSLHPSKFSSWFCWGSSFKAELDRSDTFSLVGSVHNSYHNVQLINLELLAVPSVSLRPCKPYGYSVSRGHNVIMWGQNLRRQQNISLCEMGLLFPLLFTYFYPKEKLICLHSHRTIGSMTYGFIISAAKFICYDVSEMI